jgi:hypothetical protein
MGRWLVVGSMLTALGATSACSSSGTSTLDGSAVEREIIDSTESELDGAAVSKATCPASRPVERGDTFTCTLLIDGQEVKVRVTQDVKAPKTYERGSYFYELDGKVLAQEISQYEDAAAAFVLQNEGVDVAIDCGGTDGRRWLFVAGKTSLDCMVDYGDLSRGLRVGVARNGKVRNMVFTQARLDRGVVNERASQQLIAQLGGPFVLSCPDTFANDSVNVAFDPGATFECTAVRNLGDVGRVRIEVLDVNGRITASIV